MTDYEIRQTGTDRQSNKQKCLTFLHHTVFKMVLDNKDTTVGIAFITDIFRKNFIKKSVYFIYNTFLNSMLNIH